MPRAKDLDVPKRPEMPDAVKNMVWGAAGGHCVLCGRTVIENDVQGTVVTIGEIAHIVGWGEDSPRGDDSLPYEERQEPENLILLCRDCHKPIDSGGYIKAFTREVLLQRKREQEERIKTFIEYTTYKPAVLLRLIGDIRGSSPSLHYHEAFTATIAAGMLPKLLPRQYRTEVDVDLRRIPGEGTRQYYETCARQLDATLSTINDGIRHDEIRSLAVFAFARIPVLVYLGSKLDDKVDTVLFQRRRGDGENPWIWPDSISEAPQFLATCLREGANPQRAALIVNLSGTVPLSEVAARVAPDEAIYEIAPAPPAAVDHNIISTRKALENFEATARSWLAQIERDHGRLKAVDLFGAIPLTPAITLGRILMPNVSPAWTVHERDDEGIWQVVMEVQR